LIDPQNGPLGRHPGHHRRTAACAADNARAILFVVNDRTRLAALERRLRDGR
jgi:hypothetical protein